MFLSFYRHPDRLQVDFERNDLCVSSKARKRCVMFVSHLHFVVTNHFKDNATHVNVAKGPRQFISTSVCHSQLMTVIIKLSLVRWRGATGPLQSVDFVSYNNTGVFLRMPLQRKQCLICNISPVSLSSDMSESSLQSMAFKPVSLNELWWASVVQTSFTIHTSLCSCLVFTSDPQQPTGEAPSAARSEGFCLINL